VTTDSPPLVEQPTGSISFPQRLRWLDNLKVALVAGVIVAHAFITYGNVGSWQYNEPSGNDLFNVIASLSVSIGAFFAMGLFFLIAGWLTPRSLARKGSRVFVRDRLVRLGLPFLAFLFLIYPLVGWMGDGMEGSAIIALREEVEVLDPGPLWFVAVLLIFSLGYVAWRTIRPATGLAPTLAGSYLARLGGLVAITTFLIRLEFPIDSVQVLWLHVWMWPQCLGLFALGILAGERGWLDPVPDAIRRGAGRWAAVAVLLLITAFAISHESVDPFSGGWTWQATVVAATEGTMSVALAVWLLAFFQRRHNRGGPVARAAGRGAFGAYILQAPVLVGMALGLRGLPVAPEVKFLVVAPLGVLLSFALGWGLTRIPGIRRVI
jgi:surface polysaccharide O-acyltransferase-like enzyme